MDNYTLLNAVGGDSEQPGHRPVQTQLPVVICIRIMRRRTRVLLAAQGDGAEVGEQPVIVPKTARSTRADRMRRNAPARLEAGPRPPRPVVIWGD
jgi:hypothetical protein